MKVVLVMSAAVGNGTEESAY